MNGNGIPDPGAPSKFVTDIVRSAAPDLTTDAARSTRDQLIDRIEVLDKVGVLRMLPDDMHATTSMAAQFYEVDDATLRQVVQRNREEFDDDGYEVINRGEVSDKLSLTPDELGMPRNAGSLALFPRRAILRVGMLLRDSPIAKLVRDYLLNVEESAREDEDVLIHRALTVATNRIAALSESNRELTEKVAEDAPKVNYVDKYVASGHLLKLRTIAANNHVGEDWLRDLLIDRGWIYCETIQYYSKKAKRIKVRHRYSAYAHKQEYFEPVSVHEAPLFKGEVMHTLKITPVGAEAISRFIEREVAA